MPGALHKLVHTICQAPARCWQHAANAHDFGQQHLITGLTESDMLTFTMQPTHAGRTHSGVLPLTHRDLILSNDHSNVHADQACFGVSQDLAGTIKACQNSGTQPGLLGPPLPPWHTQQQYGTWRYTESSTQCDSQDLIHRLNRRQCPDSATINQGHVCC